MYVFDFYFQSILDCIHILRMHSRTHGFVVASVMLFCLSYRKTYEGCKASFVFVFSVQAEVIPAILESVSSGLLLGPGGYRPRDICVSAPTGSGKTLAFVIPVVQVYAQTVNCIHDYICFGTV